MDGVVLGDLVRVVLNGYQQHTEPWESQRLLH